MDEIALEWMRKYSISCSSDQFEHAITHPSLKVNDPKLRDYEQLETIGDAVLDLLILKHILEEIPSASPSQLTKGRSNIVNNKILGMVGERLGLHKIIQVHHSYTIVQKDLSNCLEAIFGAIFLECGMDKCSYFLNQILDDIHEILDQVSGGIDVNERYSNPVGKLQELAQSMKLDLPNYCVVEKKGPDNDPDFTLSVSISIDGKTHKEYGRGGSKKRAKVKAARNLVKLLDEKNLL